MTSLYGCGIREIKLVFQNPRLVIGAADFQVVGYRVTWQWSCWASALAAVAWTATEARASARTSCMVAGTLNFSPDCRSGGHG